ncbi:hypothetical protein MUK42_36839 [Musa troglodytarum]|uniref:Uncharacterized protein n=1 Tax=Musa troglodytarum TaxID=320322 RepID=A0A9E7EFU3_9LILI|nr:hypothetical protein MUK42_36839 [Musa troglodytarum]
MAMHRAGRPRDPGVVPCSADLYSAALYDLVSIRTKRRRGRVGKHSTQAYLQEPSSRCPRNHLSRKRQPDTPRFRRLNKASQHPSKYDELKPTDPSSSFSLQNDGAKFTNEAD